MKATICPLVVRVPAWCVLLYHLWLEKLSYVFYLSLVRTIALLSIRSSDIPYVRRSLTAAIRAECLVTYVMVIT